MISYFPLRERKVRTFSLITSLFRHYSKNTVIAGAKFRRKEGGRRRDVVSGRRTRDSSHLLRDGRCPTAPRQSQSCRYLLPWRIPNPSTPFLPDGFYFYFFSNYRPIKVKLFLCVCAVGIGSKKALYP